MIALASTSPPLHFRDPQIIFFGTLPSDVEAFFTQHVAWAAVNFPYTTDSGGQRNKFIMVRWVPDTLERSTMRETVRLKTSGVMLAGDLVGAFTRDGAKKLQANDPSDLDLFTVLDFVSKFERDKVVRESVVPLAASA